MTKVGCKLPRTKATLMESLPLCDNSTLFDLYSNEYYVAMGMGRNELIERTKCLLPCSFIEYKVRSLDFGLVYI